VHENQSLPFLFLLYTLLTWQINWLFRGTLFEMLECVTLLRLQGQKSLGRNLLQQFQRVEIDVYVLKRLQPLGSFRVAHRTYLSCNVQKFTTLYATMVV